jgi:hypothetical protein
MRGRLLPVAAIALACVAIASPAASGDGGPGPGVVQGWNGITAGEERYVAVPAVGWTAIQAIKRNGGRVDRWMTLKGSWGIPVVANDGTTDGLLSDRRRLLVAKANTGRYLRKHSSFALIDMRKMRVLQRVRLPGHHTFDALSPDGRYLYLVEYVSQADFSRYRVRAYDMRARRLHAELVNDKSESVENMQGWPVAREKSPDRRWAYTLYAGGHHAFIHALDTKQVEAICIDMPWHKQPKRLFEFRLRLDPEGNLVVRGPRGRALVVIDRQDHSILSSVRNP